MRKIDRDILWDAINLYVRSYTEWRIDKQKAKENVDRIVEEIEMIAIQEYLRGRK